MGSGAGTPPSGVHRSLEDPPTCKRRRRGIPRRGHPLNSALPLQPGEEVFLTGGTGLVGSHLAILLRKEGHPVRAFHRPGAKVGFLHDLGCELVEGSLGEGSAKLAPAMEGCAALVHTAAVVYSRLPWAEVRRVNVEGAREVFEAASQAGVRRGVHLSSVAVYGNPASPIDETCSIDTALSRFDRYARSKREGEMAVREVARRSGLSVVILRPSAVYGERDRLLTRRLRAILRFPLHPLPGGGDTPLAAVYAGNLADAILMALRGTLPEDISTFNVADDHPVTQREILAGIAGALSVPFRPVSIPRSLILSGAVILEGIRRAGPFFGELSPLRVARLALNPNPFLSERIRRELSWCPPWSKEEAILRTARGIVGEEDQNAGESWEG